MKTHLQPQDHVFCKQVLLNIYFLNSVTASVHWVKFQFAAATTTSFFFSKTVQFKVKGLNFRV